MHNGLVSAAKGLHENTIIDVDAEGRICAMTLEHARDRADLAPFS